MAHCAIAHLLSLETRVDLRKSAAGIQECKGGEADRGTGLVLVKFCSHGW